jgi:hypothetical protein
MEVHLLLLLAMLALLEAVLVVVAVQEETLKAEALALEV